MSSRKKTIIIIYEVTFGRKSIFHFLSINLENFKRYIYIYIYSFFTDVFEEKM